MVDGGGAPLKFTWGSDGRQTALENAEANFFSGASSPPANLNRKDIMKIDVSTKGLWFLITLVVLSIGVLGLFSYEAVVDFGQNIVIMPMEEFEQISFQ